MPPPEVPGPWFAVAVDARTAARVVAEAMKANVLLRCMDALRGNG
jgi:hypothetical protein